MSERKFKVTEKRGRLAIAVGGRTYSLEPPASVTMTLPPYAEGIESLLRRASKMKGIQGEFDVCISDEWMPLCDFRAELVRDEFGGKLFSIHPERTKISGSVWICGEGYQFGSPGTIFFASLD